MTKHLSIGSDPEFLVVNENEECIPAFYIIDGTKLSPKDLELPGYQVLYDNTLIEGNIPPASSKEGFISNMESLKRQLNTLISPYDLHIQEADIGKYNKIHLSDKRAQEFGCSPFEDAWIWDIKSAPKIKASFRPVGFHIHVGYEIPENYNENYPKESLFALINNAIARAYDFLVIMPALPESDPRRANNYGGYGKFRNKPYGLELRSLGGKFAHRKYLGWVYDQTVKAVSFVLESFENADTLLRLESTSDINAENFEAIFKTSVTENKIIVEQFEKTLVI